MADYDTQGMMRSNLSATVMYPNGGQPSPGPNIYHGNGSGVDIDTATIVSIASSCIILISGCIAVVCLIMYMKKTDMLYRSRTCAKCGAHVSQLSSRVPFRNESNAALEGLPVLANHTFHPAIEAHQSVNKSIGSMAIYRGFADLHGESSENHSNFPFGNDIENEVNAGPMLVPNNLTSKLSPGEFIKSEDFFDDTNEPTPYATFNLPGFDKDSKIGEVYETFTAKFTEPPYMLLKKGFEERLLAPPQYADSVDYKMRLIEDVGNKVSEDTLYQAIGLSQCHSVASSNQEELFRAYEYGKQQKQKLLKLQDEFIECLNENDNDEAAGYLASDRESPTDPGIREFTKSPPKPNEQRQGIVFHHQPTTAEMNEFSKQMTSTGVKEGEYGLKQARQSIGDIANTNDLSPNETSNSFSSIQGSSSEARSSSSNESTPSAGSESGNGEDSSSSTATPEQLSDEERQPHFGAIPRDRSRNPSWASFTTMKSNTVLTSQLPPERSFVSESDNQIKEGLSSDEDNVPSKPNPSEFASNRTEQNLLEDIYGTKMAAYSSRNQGYIVKQKACGKEKVPDSLAKSRCIVEQKTAVGSRSISSGFHPSPGPSQEDKSSVVFCGPNERLPGISNRTFNRTAL